MEIFADSASFPPDSGSACIDIGHDLNHNDRTGHYVWRLPLVTEVSAVVFRQNLGEMLNQVQYRKDSIIVSKDGRPVAALVDAELFARIRRMNERFEQLAGRVAEAYADVPEEEGLAEIDAAVWQQRHG